ncbi:MAG: F0F1 ATP synthase subunit epsilon [Anaerolineae bacterium]|nr:F0F1 ATP synthase subunit epsilon [Anaerolineae bacterium]
MPFRCEIVTQERVVFSGEADYVSLPGTEGVMGVLPNHSAMLTSLAFGEVMVRSRGQEEFFAVGGGFVEIQPDHITVLADSAEQAEEIDVERAQRAREHAEQMMKEGVPTDPVHYQQIQIALQKAQIRMDVARKRQHRRTMPHLSGE